jgi:tRNA (guanine37-N1)-methyltransferase
MLRIDVITLFPESFDSILNSSILARAIRLKKIEIRRHQLRDFAQNKWRKVDDKPFGGGAGMLMACQPLFDAVKKIKGRSQKKIPVIYFSPRGRKLDQPFAEEIAENYERLILVCGHYEGVDQRFIDACVDLEVSIGDYVLTGGELPALVLIDAVARLIPGVVGKAASVHEESFSAELDRKKEYPHYTQPADFRGMKVPTVLLSGDHGAIKKWRRSQTKS